MPNANLVAAQNQLRNLVSIYNSNFDQYQQATYNETQVRVDFVNPFFQLLGWDVLNEAGLPQHLREVTHEATVLVEENGAHRSKKPDYSFKVGTEILFFLETKKPSVNITVDRAPSFQLRRYGWSGNLKVSVLTNFTDLFIWLPFLVLACKALKPDGRVGMVIPAELFQVDYAAEARLFLSNYFESLTLVTFKKLVFDDIQQEVILLLGERKSSKQGIRVVELDGLESLISAGQTCLEVAEVKKLDHSKDKWVKYYLSNEELNLLNRLNKSSKITNATDLYDVNVGLVSGENAFFVINQEIVDKFHLQESVVPIISRTDQIKGLELTEQDYENLVKAGKKVYFFEPADLPIDELPKSQRKYIQWGEAQEYNKNYKCRIRPRWYHVSYTWRAEAFLVRQANLYPKMVLNNKHALVTDTLHKVRFHEGVDGRTVVGAFLNTYTLALSETLGRSYGGGVLTFEPGEMRKMRIPMIAADKLDLDKMDALQREGKIDDILQYTDEILLHQGLGLTAHEVELLHNIWSKMKDRRLSRKNRKG